MTLLVLLGLTAAPLPVKDLTYREGTLEIIGRYRDSLDKRVWLHETKRPFGIDEKLKYEIEFVVAGEIDTRLIFSLTSGKDNLIIRGRFTRQGKVGVPATAERPATRPKPATFRAESIRKAPPDTELYMQQAAEPSNGSAELLALGKEGLARAEMFEDDELRRLAVSILRRGYEARRNETDHDDTAGHLQWVREMVRYVGDTDWALREGKAILQRRPGWEEAERFLHALGCVKWRGHWLTRDKFMHAQGYTNVKGTWTRPEDLLFEKSRKEAEKIRANGRILRTHTTEYYNLNAEQGKLVVGMTRQEAVKAWGFPDDVRRLRKGKETFDQWRYGTNYVYLLDNLVAIIPNEDGTEY